jgi:colanic acid biosynthesis glycosyl transferase WcaI
MAIEEPTTMKAPSATRQEKWLVLTQYYSPEVGAPQIRLRCFVKELRHHGKAVSVLTAMPNYPAGRIFDQYRGRYFCSEQIDGVEVKRTWVYPATGKAFLPRFLNYCAFAMTALPVALFGPRPDVLFVEGQPLPLGIVALLMKWLRGVPYIYNVPDLQVDVARELGFIRRRSLLWLAAQLETLLLRSAWKISTVTHHFMKHFESRGIPSGRITFLPNGADTQLLSPKAPCVEYLDDWNLRDKIVFVYVGTHAYYHGLDTLICAAAILKTEPHIRIVMVGDGPERERLRQLATDQRLDNIVFASASYARTADVYSVAYAAIATLRNVPVAEGMRLSKVFPALSCGVPVIYSGKGEAAQLLDQNDCGVVTPPEDADALARAMLSLAKDGARHKALGRNGRRLVHAMFRWDSIVENWLQELQPPDKTPVHGETTLNLEATNR